MKILSKLFTLVLTIGMLSGCGPTTSEPTTVTPPESTGPTTVTGPSMEDFVDYVHTDTRARLTLDYKNTDGSSRNFFTDGIGQVELRNAIDGDTAHFNPVNATGNEYIKTRFYGIDTPESTGQIQLWGKSASKFTSEKLKNAAANGTIVLSSPSQTYAEPQVDSTGSRYLGLVWINETVKNADYKDLVLLNLWVVQEGYSATKSVDKVPEYAEVFFDADRQAQAYELHIWGDEIDPNYNYGDYEPVSIIAIKDEERWSKAKGYENPYYDANVHIEATVTGYSDHIIYVQEYYDYDWMVEYLDRMLDEGKIEQDEYHERLETSKDGVYAGIGLFTGMSFSNDKRYTTPNTRIEVNGSVGYQFGLQIQGISCPNIYSGGTNEVHILHTAEEVLSDDSFETFRVHNFNVDATDLKKDDEYLFMKVEVNDTLVVTGGKDDKEDAAVRLDVETEDGKKLEFSINITFIFFPDPVNSPRKRWTSYEHFMGKRLKVQGIYYFFNYSSGNYSVDYYNVLPTVRDDITLLDPIA
jgi:endonuclease YncB( thermonuclease family)